MKLKILFIQYLIALLLVITFSSCDNSNTIKRIVHTNDFPYELLVEKNDTEASINNFIKYPQEFKFKFLKQGEGIGINKNQTYWIRFKLNQNNNQKSWILETTNFMHLCLYKPQTNHTYTKECFNPSTPISKRSLFSHKQIYLLEPNHTDWYYGEVKSDIPMGLGFSIFSIKDFIFYSTIEIYFLVTLFSIIVFLNLITIILFIKLKELIFVYYFFFLLSSLMYYLVYIGLFHPIFGIEKTAHIHYTVFYSFITISFLLYSKEFLKFNKTPILGLNYLPTLVIARILILIISFWDSFEILRSSKIDLIMILFCLIPSYFAISAKLKSGYLYFVSLCIILFGYFSHTVLHDSIWENSLPYYFVRVLAYGAGYIQFFMFLEILFFSYALIERYAEIKNKNEDQTKNAIKVQKFVNDEMAFIVKVRTKELEIANQQLQENAIKIAEMNKLLSDDNELLIRDVELLRKARFIDQNLNFIEFKSTFTSDNVAYEFLAQLKWKNGYNCKKCNYKKFYMLDHMTSRKCKLCGYTESSIVDTILDNIHFSSVKALYIVYVTFHLPKINLTALSKEIELRAATCSVFHKKVTLVIETKSKKNKNKHTIVENENSWINILM